MAEIHVLNCRLGPDGARRLADDLTTMLARGEDPGPREQQMRSIGYSLERTLQSLRTALRGEPVLDEMADLLALCEQTARLVQPYTAAATPAV